MSENVGASTSRNPKGLHSLYGDNFTFTLQYYGHYLSEPSVSDYVQINFVLTYIVHLSKCAILE
jgi:hypothetical protein